MAEAPNPKTVGRLAGLAYLAVIVFSAPGSMILTGLLAGLPLQSKAQQAAPNPAASKRGAVILVVGDSLEALQQLAAGWRRRIATADATGSTSALADLGRPVIGQVSPAEELDTVLADLAQLDTRSTHAKL